MRGCRAWHGECLQAAAPGCGARHVGVHVAWLCVETHSCRAWHRQWPHGVALGVQGGGWHAATGNSVGNSHGAGRVRWLQLHGVGKSWSLAWGMQVSVCVAAREEWCAAIGYGTGSSHGVGSTYWMLLHGVGCSPSACCGVHGVVWHTATGPGMGSGHGAGSIRWLRLHGLASGPGV